MNRKSTHHLRIGFGLMLLLASGTAFSQSQAADKARCYNVATDGKAWCSRNNCKLVCDGTPNNPSSSPSSNSNGYSNNATRTEAIANGVSTLIDIFGPARVL